jgi:hypothetical protein
MTQLTAVELARLVAGSTYNEELVFRRIRDWTVRGLLAVEGDVNPGHGKKRHYAQSMVIKAAALNRLAEVGVGPVTVRAAATTIDEVVGSHHLPLYLVINKLDNKEQPDILISNRSGLDKIEYADYEYVTVVRIG